MRLRVIVATMVFLCLSGCVGLAAPAYSACAAQPGSYACQVEQYERVSN